MPSLSTTMPTIRSTFDRFGVVGYKDDTGIGRQCHNMQTVLGIGYHLVTPSTRLQAHELDSQRDRPLLPTASRNHLQTLTQDLVGVIVIERNKWHHALFETMKHLGKRLILVPNWEWFDHTDRSYSLVDLFIVHSRYALRLLNCLGYANVVMLPPPIDLSLLPPRHITSRPTYFLHNAGIIDATDRKGTFLTLQAWTAKRPSSARLVVRYQKSDLPFPPVVSDQGVLVRVGSTPAPADLYVSGHCAIQPSRLEGLGYMVLEPILSGIPTITTDVPPMNEWPRGTLLCNALPPPEDSLPRKRGIGSAVLHDVDTRSLAALIEGLEECDLSDLSKQARQFRRELAPERVRAQWQRALQQL